MKISSRSTFVGLASLILGVLLFSTIEVCSKLMQNSGAIAGENPFWLASIRFVVTGLIFLQPACRAFRQRELRFDGRAFWQMFGMGFVGVTLMASLFHIGLLFLPANVAALIFSCNPVFVILIAAVVLAEPITLRKLIAVLLCLGGVVVLGAQSGSLSILGVVLMVAAMLSFALYTVLCKKIIPRYGAMAITSFSSLLGGLALIPIAIVREGWSLASYGSADWIGVAYLTLFGTALGYLLYTYGIGRVGAGVGSMTFFLKPFAAALFAWLILVEEFSTVEQIAGAFILAGMIVALAPAKPFRKALAR